jgi:hypothetical protein
MAKFQLKLTDEQRKLIEQEFGHDVPQLILSVEDFNSPESDDPKLRVLKIENIASIHSALADRQSVVN